MSRPTAPGKPPVSDEQSSAYAIDVDPTLIEAALASVDRVAKKAKRGSRKPAAPSIPEEEMIFDPGDLGEPPPEPTDEEVFDPGELGEPGDVGAPGEAQAAPIPPVATESSGPEFDVDVEVEAVEAEPPPAAPQVDDIERVRLQLRIREQADLIQRLEARLTRATEISDGLDKQVRELRNFARKLESEADLVRQRHRRERDEAERRAEENSVRGLIDVVDNVERAVAFAEADPGKLTAGLHIIREQFRALLRKLNIDRIPAEVGTPFDPAMHEAVLHTPSPDATEGSILSEVSAGFRLRGRLLRPARVVVAAGAPASSAE